MSAGGERSTSSMSGFQEAQGTTSSFNNSQGNSFLSDFNLPQLQQLMGTAGGFLGNAGQAQADVQNAYTQSLPAMLQGLTGLQGQTNPQGQIDAQAASLSAGLGDMFRNEINPALESNAIGVGGLGGGRQGVAQANAVGELGNAYTQGLGDITARANAQSLAASSQIPSFIQSMMANAQMPSMAAMGPLGALSQIFGGPTVLSQQSSEGGLESQNTSYGEQKSEQKSSGFRFGL